MKRYRLYYWYYGRLHKATDSDKLNSWGGKHLCFDTPEEAAVEAEIFANKHGVDVAIADYEAQAGGYKNDDGVMVFPDRLIDLIHPDKE